MVDWHENFRLKKNMVKLASIYSFAFALIIFGLSSVSAQNSAPQPVPIVNKIPAPKDVPLSAPMQLTVDARDISRAIFRVKQTIPVTPGKPLILLYPEWLPGKHAPRGAIAELAGLKIRSGGKLLKWTRDPVNVYAFHVDTPAGARQVEAEFQFLTPLRSREGRRVITPEMMNVQWEQVSLYPAGHFVRAIRVRPSIILPAGWTGVAALDGARKSGSRIDYGETDYETLIDSPMFAGRHYRKWDLGHKVTLNVWADEPKSLAATKEHIDAHRRLVDQTVKLYGAKHFDRYEFLLALTDELGGIGLEHHRSSENTRSPKYFTDWKGQAAARGLLPHELVHSWNGKFRRPATMWTPNYSIPMRDNLLWVYEGQTSFWDLVLAARSGFQSKELILGEIARSAAYFSLEPGRQWRSVEDTTHDPIVAARKRKPNSSWARNESYYTEGALTWLAADMIIREKSGGRRSLDDFARAFFGIRDGDWGVLTYEFDDVIAAMNAVQPHNWASFFDAKLRQPGQPAPLLGIEKGGYRLVFKEKPNISDQLRFASNPDLNLIYSLGMRVTSKGVVNFTIWDSPAFNASLVNDTRIVAINDLAFTKTRMRDAITAAKASKKPIKLLIERDGRFRTQEIRYFDGLRYPHLEKVGKGDAPLDELLKPLK